MNDRKLKKALKEIYIPPASQRRDTFLQELEKSNRQSPVLSLKDFMWVQLHYISPYIWVVNGVFFLLMTGFLWEVSGSYRLGKLEWKYDVIAKVSAMVPFLAISSLTELNRSARHRMEELEMSTRFSLQAVLLARMGILGGCNLLLFLAAILFTFCWKYLKWMEIGLCFFGPYCLTTILVLWFVRRFRNGLNGSVCLAAAAGAGLWGIITNRLRFVTAWILEFSHPGVILLCLLLMTGYESKRYLAQFRQEIGRGSFRNTFS